MPMKECAVWWPENQVLAAKAVWKASKDGLDHPGSLAGHMPN